MNNKPLILQSPAPPKKSPQSVFQAEKSLWNAIIFQVVWFGVVYLNANNNWIESIGLSAIALIIHFKWISNRPRLDALIVLLVTICGCSIDLLASSMGWLLFADTGTFPIWGLPIWLPQLWLLFGTTPRISLKTFVKLPWLGASLAFVSAPFSYGVVGSSWELSSYAEPLWLSAPIHGLFWGLLFWNLKRGMYWLDQRQESH